MNTSQTTWACFPVWEGLGTRQMLSVGDPQVLPSRTHGVQLVGPETGGPDWPCPYQLIMVRETIAQPVQSLVVEAECVVVCVDMHTWESGGLYLYSQLPVFKGHRRRPELGLCGQTTRVPLLASCVAWVKVPHLYDNNPLHQFIVGAK